ncbi:hypothetical protein [Dyadobacter beijingensis]|nr:hypothetical protein [Dyadobacter beijingensis]
MDWITGRNPEVSGTYLVSSEFYVANGKRVFPYVAYYNEADEKWYKYNPFSEKLFDEPMESPVLGWIEVSILIM